MKHTRKKYDTKFKAKVSIVAINERVTFNELAAKQFYYRFLNRYTIIIGETLFFLLFLFSLWNCVFD